MSVEFLLCYLISRKDRMVALTMRQPAASQRRHLGTDVCATRDISPFFPVILPLSAASRLTCPVGGSSFGRQIGQSRC